MIILEVVRLLHRLRPLDDYLLLSPSSSCNLHCLVLTAGSEALCLGPAERRPPILFQSDRTAFHADGNGLLRCQHARGGTQRAVGRPAANVAERSVEVVRRRHAELLY